MNFGQLAEHVPVLTRPLVPMRTAARWMIGVGISVIILTVVLAGTAMGSVRFRQERTRRAIRHLLNACAQYRMEYGHWPGTAQTKEDIRFGLTPHPNRQLLNILRARDERGNRGHTENPHRTVFIKVESWRPGRPGIDSWGDMLDPWGSPFQIVVDGNLNGVCEITRSVYGNIEAGIVVWSYGPDRRADTMDDLVSWRRRP